MRIRSIRPEFWSSEDIASLPWDYRLIYIGLWSYVDDNGVGRDVPKLIAADLFPLEDQSPLKQIHGALSEYSRRGMITRYEVNGKPFLHITAWDEHQKINRPSGGRYPLPTREDAVIHDTLTEPSLSPHAKSPLGEGEKGRRGEGKSPAPAVLDSDFITFWDTYPKKVSKGQAVTAWKKALKKEAADVIIAAASVYASSVKGNDPQFTANPSTWLNGERWADEVRSVERNPAAMSNEELWA